MDCPKTPRLVLLAVFFSVLLTACKDSDHDRAEMDDNAAAADAEAGDAETRDAGDTGDTSTGDAQIEAGQLDSGLDAGDDAGMTGRGIDGSASRPPSTDGAVANNTDSAVANNTDGAANNTDGAANNTDGAANNTDGAANNTDGAVANSTDGASSSTGDDASAEQDASADAAAEPSADAGGNGPLEDAATEDASPDAGSQSDGGAGQSDGGTGEVLVESSFEQDAEGWTIVGDAQGSSGTPAYEGTDGNPGGCIRADDDSVGEVWYFTAPGSYLGDRSETLGRYLSFDLKTTDVTNLKSAPDVLLEGGGLTIAYDATPEPSADWTSYRILLSAEGWRLNDLDGIAVTDEQFASVLSSLTALRIRGEFNSGPDTGSLDNVEFGAN